MTKQPFKSIIKGFTLIELLLVIAILGILAVALLVALNPAKSQRKARDTKRIADLKTLQILIDQYLSDGGDPSALAIGTTGVRSNTVTSQNNQPACAPGGGALPTWLGIDTCVYAPTVPLDPHNGLEKVFVTDAALGTTAAVVAEYRAIIAAGDYEINARVESITNADKVTNDGGSSVEWVEVGTNLTLY